MPKVTIWVREADWEAWQMIDDIPDFITRSIAREIVEDAIQVRDHIVKEGRKLGKLPEQEDTEWCKHGAALGLCKFGCK